VTTKKGLTVVALFAMGLSMLLIAIYLLVTEIYFVYHAVAFEAPIVEVQTELVPKGKGSVVAYVPKVEISDESGNKLRVKVATFDEEPVYRVGDRIHVVCDLSSLRCIRNNFMEKWGNFTVTFLLSLVFLAIPSFYYRRRAV
jgi:hypothetical protein